MSILGQAQADQPSFFKELLLSSIPLLIGLSIYILFGLLPTLPILLPGFFQDSFTMWLFAVIGMALIIYGGLRLLILIVEGEFWMIKDKIKKKDGSQNDHKDFAKAFEFHLGR